MVLKGGFGRNETGVGYGGWCTSTQVPPLGELKTKATTGGIVRWGSRTGR